MVYLLFVICLILFFVTLYYKNLYNSERKQREKVSFDFDILHKQQIFFIRKMIHEMKTPLSAIELHLAVLTKEHCGVKNVAMIKSSVRMLTTIYDDIAFHVGKEKICYPHEWIELEEFIADRILYFDSMASVKNIFLELQSDTGYYVNISKTELQRIIDNSLSNAIKYSTNSSEVVEIIILYDNGDLNLIFKDNGIGMSEKEVENIFKAYYRVNDNIQGLGLGMNIIKEICDDYGIDINIQSIKKQGSTFIYKIPKNIVMRK